MSLTRLLSDHFIAAAVVLLLVGAMCTVGLVVLERRLNRSPKDKR